MAETGRLTAPVAPSMSNPVTLVRIAIIVAILVSVIFFFLTDRLERWLRPAA